MKRIYLFLLGITIGTLATAQFGQIPNGGFENWQQDIIYENPDIWKSSNTDQFYGTPTLTKSTDASDGIYSAKLSVTEVGGNIVNGYVYHGVAGSSGPQSGIPYTDNFEAFNIYFKSDLAVGDTANLFMIRYLSGVAVDFAIKPIAFGVNSTWTQQIIFVGNQPQDSLFVGFILGDPNGVLVPDTSSWVMIDNVQLLSGGVATTNLPNHSFETWNNVTTENPVDWYSINYLLQGSNSENVVKTTDANTGTYAAQLSTILLNGADTVQGFISLGKIDFTNASSPFELTPYSATPTSISGSYKYVPAGADAGAISVVFYAGGIPIGSHNETFTAQSVYTNFSSVISIAGTPDSILFLASPGNNPGSVLKLDDLAFSGGTVGVQELLTVDFNLYPNPVKEIVYVKLPEEGKFNLSIQDMSGRTVYSIKNVNGIQEIVVNQLESGSYFVKVINGDVLEMKKLVIE